jgi:hypothetical protein
MDEGIRYESTADARGSAAMLRGLFNAFTEVGFDEEQSMALLLAVIARPTNG